MYSGPTDFVQVHDQARQRCQFKKTFFFQTIDLRCSCKSFRIGSQDYYNAIIILLRIQICGGLRDGNIKRTEMPLKQSIFVHQIQMLRGCFRLIIYNWINDTWLPSVFFSLSCFPPPLRWSDFIFREVNWNRFVFWTRGMLWGVKKLLSLAFKLLRQYKSSSSFGLYEKVNPNTISAPLPLGTKKMPLWLRCGSLPDRSLHQQNNFG